LHETAGPTALDLILATFVIILIPLGVLLIFAVDWWLAFIPLAAAGLLIIVLIFMYFRRLLKDAERRDNIM
jgi:membrane protein implicated in regulation of membrane protease activity